MKIYWHLSDTHGFWDKGLTDFLKHAMRFGMQVILDRLVADNLAKLKPLRAVHGNIDDYKTRLVYPEKQLFTTENVNILITHIAGTPGHYDQKVLEILKGNKVNILVCGHSHILRVKYDKQWDMLYINPGAAGNSGFHQVKTAIRLKIDGSNISDLEVWEKKRGF